MDTEEEFLNPKANYPSLAEILDLKQMESLFRHFQVVTGLDVALFDFSGKELHTVRKDNSVCALAGNCRKCREYIAYGGLMSGDLGEPYICACGCGLIMCFSPVMYNEYLAGVIACGPVLLWEADEVAVSEFTEKIQDMQIKADIPELLRSVAPLSCINMTSASQLLFIMVNGLTREHSVYLDQRSRITSQQRQIAELIIERKEGKKKGSSDTTYPKETEKELIEVVEGGSREQSGRILNKLLGEIFSFAEGNINTIRARLFELLAFFSRSAVEAGAPVDDINRIIGDAYAMFNEDTDFESLCFLAGRAIDGFIETAFRKRQFIQRSRHLEKAIAWIGVHYAGNVSLHSVAEAVYVSEYYLSHLFRKEMNTTFSDYLSRVRIHKAREILKSDRDIRIQEIIELVGFNDPAYFAKSFKKLTGVSPREYQSFFFEDREKMI
ncbi:MAG: PocR ligand-binding domain-containing protein [Treponema sp.]|jgi:two-component system response regulator YesN|nr:PocR ligand-binding domain-containing protein [Treponema sp.]